MRIDGSTVKAIFSLILVTIPATIFGQNTTQNISALNAPEKTVTFSSSAPIGAVSPTFNHGYLIQFKQNTGTAGESNIYLYNSSGQLEHVDAIWPADTAKLFLASVDVGIHMQLAFSGQSIKENGSRKAFVAIADLGGKSPSYFNTGNYLATQVAVAADGSIWTIGAEYASSDDWPKRWDNYDLLRHYSADGTLLEHYLPRWGDNVAYVVETSTDAGKQDSAYDKQGTQLADWKSQPGYRAASKQSNHEILRVVDNGPILYNGSSREIFKWNNKSNTLTKWILPSVFDDMATTGVAILPSGQIYASRYKKTDKTVTTGVYELHPWSNGAAEWKVVTESQTILPDSPVHLQILGADNDALVYRRGNSFPTSVQWSTIAVGK